MPGVLLIGSAVASSLLLAATGRFRSLVTTLLVAYLALVANVGLVTLVLSPFREVTRGGLAVAEGLLLAGALAAWWARGRPGLPLESARAAVRDACSDPVTVVFIVAVGLLLAYELVLALFVPPNNGDSVGYHLPRAVSWAQHGGIYWIENAPTLRMNAFQPLAEQQILFLFVATGSGLLFAMPQYVAELAILLAVYGCSRRLGYETRAAAAGALLFATFSLVALEATTAQNDLVAAALPVVAACLLLGGGRLEASLAGVAAGMALGVKLTTALVVPVLFWLALLRGRRIAAVAVAGGIAGFVAIGAWGYVLNQRNSGAWLGAGTAHIENRGSPSYPGSVANAFYLLYGMMDASVLSSRLIHALALIGLVVAVAVGAWTLRRASLRRAVDQGARVALAFLAPILVIGGAAVVAFIAGRWGFPIRGDGGIVGPLNEILALEYTRISNEDFSAFGPVGIVTLVAAIALTIGAYALRRVDARHLALAAALPSFLILVSLFQVWNPFLIRFFLVPAVLAAPLLARLFAGRVTTAAFAVVAALVVGITITRDQTKPFESYYGFGHPWNLTQVESLHENTRQPFAEGLAAFQRLVPPHACVGAVVGDSDPSYVLFGPRFEHRVVFLPGSDPVARALEHGLWYVVINAGATPVVDAFGAAGWHTEPMGGWTLASAPAAGSGACDV